MTRDLTDSELYSCYQVVVRQARECIECGDHPNDVFRVLIRTMGFEHAKGVMAELHSLANEVN